LAETERISGREKEGSGDNKVHLGDHVHFQDSHRARIKMSQWEINNSLKKKKIKRTTTTPQSEQQARTELLKWGGGQRFWEEERGGGGDTKGRKTRFESVLRGGGGGKKAGGSEVGDRGVDPKKMIVGPNEVNKGWNRRRNIQGKRKRGRAGGKKRQEVTSFGRRETC